MAHTHHLAQLNIARMIASIHNPIMADFVNNLDYINQIAEAHEGFVWRLKGDENNATAIRVFEDERLIINMSVWTSLEMLYKFTYASGHLEVFKRKKEWFSKMTGMHMVFWYISPGHIPTAVEAKNRLKYLNENGETPYAFTFKSKFTIADALNYNS